MYPRLKILVLCKSPFILTLMGVPVIKLCKLWVLAAGLKLSGKNLNGFLVHFNFFPQSYIPTVIYVCMRIRVNLK